MSGRVTRGISRVGGILGREDWIYLPALILPLFVYTTVFRVMGIFVKDQEAGFWGTLTLLDSDAMFALGYAVFWVGVFALFRRGILRVLAAALLHASAMMVAVIATFAYKYLASTGTTLDYSVVTYYLEKPEEATGAVSSESSTLIWAILSSSVFYALCGPALVTMLVLKLWSLRASRRPNASGRVEPALSRGRFIVAGIGAVAGVFLFRESLFPPKAIGKGRFVSRSAVSNLVATRLEEGEMEAAADKVKDVVDLSGLRFVETPRTRKRHVALIHLESTRYSATSLFNHDLATTPYLKELARKSLFLKRSYTTTPHTSKAITSLNAGIYPSPETDVVESYPGALPARPLAALLGERGYKSAWFQSATETFENRRQHVKVLGYDHFEAFEQMPTKGFQKSNYLGYEDDIMLPPSREWLRQNASDPTLVMYLGVTPHHQYLPVDRYGRKSFANGKVDGGMFDRYLNNVYYDDFWVKNILDQYKNLGLYDDTIFIIYGDHGEAFGEHGVKGHDGVPYEEGLRTPLLVHASEFDDGASLEEPVHLMDYAPTVADLLGFDVAGGDYPGESFVRGGGVPEGRVLRFSCRPDLVSMARIEGYEKYIYHYGKQPEEFYDLRRDPTEQNNLVNRAGRKKLGVLREDLLEWHARSTAAYDPDRTSQDKPA